MPIVVHSVKKVPTCEKAAGRELQQCPWMSGQGLEHLDGAKSLPMALGGL